MHFWKKRGRCPKSPPPKPNRGPHGGQATIFIWPVSWNLTWSRRPDSNRPHLLGRQRCCHYTTAAYIAPGVFLPAPGTSRLSGPSVKQGDNCGPFAFARGTLRWCRCWSRTNHIRDVPLPGLDRVRHIAFPLRGRWPAGPDEVSRHLTAPRALVIFSILSRSAAARLRAQTVQSQHHG